MISNSIRSTVFIDVALFFLKESDPFYGFLRYVLPIFFIAGLALIASVAIPFVDVILRRPYSTRKWETIFAFVSSMCSLLVILVSILAWS